MADSSTEPHARRRHCSPAAEAQGYLGGLGQIQAVAIDGEFIGLHELVNTSFQCISAHVSEEPVSRWGIVLVD